MYNPNIFFWAEILRYAQPDGLKFRDMYNPPKINFKIYFRADFAFYVQSGQFNLSFGLNLVSMYNPTNLIER